MCFASISPLIAVSFISLRINQISLKFLGADLQKRGREGTRLYTKVETSIDSDVELFMKLFHTIKLGS